MAANARRIGFGRVARELQGFLNDLVDVGFDLGEIAGIGDAIVLDETLPEHVDRVALDPGVDFLLRAVGADHRVALVVADGTIGLGLDQRRPLAGAGALGGFLHRQPDREDVIAVDGNAGHAVAAGLAGHLGIERDGLERRGGGVEIVFAHEDRRRVVHRGEVEALVKGAVIDRAVAEKGDADIVAALLPGAHADADGMTDAGPDNAIGAEQADRLVIKMHGAAAAAADAVGLAEQFGHDALRISALGQRVAMPAMCRGDPVRAAEMGADADAGGFLADIEVQEARGFTLAAGDLGDAFELAEQYHLLEQVDQDLAVREVAHALLLRASVPRAFAHR